MLLAELTFCWTVVDIRCRLGASVLSRSLLRACIDPDTEAETDAETALLTSFWIDAWIAGRTLHIKSATCGASLTHDFFSSACMIAERDALTLFSTSLAMPFARLPLGRLSIREVT
jgi:hypothetical protein